MKAHHYHLTLPSPTHVWIEVGVAPPGIPATDILMFVFNTDEDEKLTSLVSYTQHRLDQVITYVHIICIIDDIDT